MRSTRSIAQAKRWSEAIRPTLSRVSFSTRLPRSATFRAMLRAKNYSRRSSPVSVLGNSNRAANAVSMVDVLSRNWWTFMIRGIAAVIFGILALAMPGIALVVLVLLFGAYALVDGVF